MAASFFVFLFSLCPLMVLGQNRGDSLPDVSGKYYAAETWKKLVEQRAFLLQRHPFDSSLTLVSNPLIDTAKAPFVYPRPPRSRYFHIGQMMGDVSFRDVDDVPVRLSDFRGKIVVINYWFVNCQPCRKEIPDLNRLAAMYRDTAVVFISITHNNAEDVNRYLELQPFIYRHLINARDPRVQSFPVNLIIDPQGRVAWSSSGLHPGTTAWMAYTIAQLLRH